MATEMLHTIEELKQLQSLPLSAKIAATENRIREWVDFYGLDGVYVSFSGGKDSLVLLHIARKLYPSIKAMYIDTGLEYPEIKSFVKTFSNVDIVRSKLTFKEVVTKYGYPFISKEVSNVVYNAKKDIASNGYDGGVLQKLARKNCLALGDILKNPTSGTKMLLGISTKSNEVITENTPDKEKSLYNCSKYIFFLDNGAPPISDKCCTFMKKSPNRRYTVKTKRKRIDGQMTVESRLRQTTWLRNGCNAFNIKSPKSSPMAFWTEQDVLQYIYDNKQEIIDWRKSELSKLGQDCTPDLKALADVYGDIIVDNRLSQDGTIRYKTTGLHRTGCMCCGFGCQREMPHGYRFSMLNDLHPQIYDYFMRGGDFDKNGDWRPDNHGLGMWYVIEFINQHGGFRIKYPNREKYLRDYLTNKTARYLYGSPTIPKEVVLLMKTDELQDLKDRVLYPDQKENRG